MSTPYVVDTTVMMQSLLEDTYTGRAQTLFYLAARPQSLVLHIPDFTLVECANVLWKQVRFQGESPHTALQMLRDLRLFPIQIHLSRSLLPRALEIALMSQLAVYDCVHIALAESLGCPLITADQRQASAAQSVAVVLKPITDFPEYSNSEN